MNHGRTVRTRHPTIRECNPVPAHRPAILSWLSDAQARQVRALRNAGESIADLVRSFGVSRATIYRALQSVETAELMSAEGGGAGG